MLLHNIPFEWVGPKKGGSDFILFGNTGVDIKVKRRTVNIQPEYVGSLPAYQAGFDADVLVFGSVNVALGTPTFEWGGWMFKRDFLLNCTECQQGEQRTQTYATKFTELELPYSAMSSMDELWSRLTAKVAA